ncbi:putative long-chain-fatty-acid--CoA ligase [Arabidopsis thaliana]|uniref:Uncharacterized protein n=2 Tax=Arabidopsis TaxID=3701 RepID=A0A654FD82_ARATH|nr:hypothetical protein ISN45_At02g042670 [Arabidopsis thaliana x Arabidopsis arenosa]CAA0377465.1 unnamed protein product [Arabidopsis thaliana]VYS55801.1 unnamed protein product [Arabidopsis thaliana]
MKLQHIFISTILFNNLNIRLRIFTISEICNIYVQSSFKGKHKRERENEVFLSSAGPVYRNLLSEKGFPPRDSDIITTWDIFSKSVENFPDNKMLGWRQIVDEKVGPYLWKTYKEVYEEVLLIGSALRAGE